MRQARKDTWGWSYWTGFSSSFQLQTGDEQLEGIVTLPCCKQESGIRSIGSPLPQHRSMSTDFSMIAWMRQLRNRRSHFFEASQMTTDCRKESRQKNKNTAKILKQSNKSMLLWWNPCEPDCVVILQNEGMDGQEMYRQQTKVGTAFLCYSRIKNALPTLFRRITSVTTIVRRTLSRTFVIKALGLVLRNSSF